MREVREVNTADLLLTTTKEWTEPKVNAANQDLTTPQYFIITYKPSINTDNSTYYNSEQSV